MVWIYAAGTILIYGVLVYSMMRPSSTTMHSGHPSSHDASMTQSVTSAVAGAVSACCVMLLGQLSERITSPRELAPAQADANSLAGLVAPDEASAVTSYLRTIPTSSSAMSPLPDVETMISRLETRLESTPRDVKAWKTLAWAYQSTGRDDMARSAYSRGSALNPDDEDLKAAAGKSGSGTDAK